MGKVDPKLLEMADVFHMPKAARMKYIILPARMPGLSKILCGKKTAGKRHVSKEHALQDDAAKDSDVN